MKTLDIIVHTTINIPMKIECEDNENIEYKVLEKLDNWQYVIGTFINNKPNVTFSVGVNKK